VHHHYASLTTGRMMLTTWLRRMTPCLRRYSTDLCQSGGSCVVPGRQTIGSTGNAAMLNVSPGVWNASTPQPVGAKLAPGLQWLPPRLLLTLPSLRGTSSVGGTGNFGMRSAVRFGVRRLKLTDRHRGDSGVPSTHCLVVGDSQPALRSLSMNSIVFLSTRLPRSDQVLLAQQACYSRKVVRKKSCVGCAYASSVPDVGYSRNFAYIRRA